MGNTATDAAVGEAPSIEDEKAAMGEQRLEQTVTTEKNLVYDDVDEVPELRARTWIALAALHVLNFIQVFALLGPPAALAYIGADLKNPDAQTWVPNSLSLVQAVLGPVISSASDTFQARKTILVASSLISFVGAAIAPGSATIYRLIGAQILIGVGFSSAPLGYAVPSEIVPRKWRPMAQAGINIAAAGGAISAPLVIGALTKHNAHTGWRTFYWIQMGFWGLTAICLFFGYHPPKRHTRYDHLSFMQKLGKLDLPGCGLLTAGLTLFLTGINLGGGLFSWTNGRVLGTLISGILILIAFALYEWKGTKTGILHHDLFRGGKEAGRTFSICVGLMFIEGITLFSYSIFYPTLTSTLFATDPFKIVVREQPFWISAAVTTMIFGIVSTKFRTIREPMLVGFVLITGGLIGLCTIQPDNSTNSLVFAGLAGLGFGAPIILVIAGVQLSTPHHLIATATAVTVSSRAVAAATFTAIFAAALRTRINTNLASDIAKAALGAGLPPSSLAAFIGALAGGEAAALGTIPGVTPKIIGAGVAALKQAFADSLRVVYMIAAPFGALGCILCLFLGTMRETMNYRVDAPVENLHAKHHHHHDTETT